ncbi:HNH endonuclease [Corynebacterium flavescens]|uniref:HNH endonuclease n=1 Tax=Corynebacterium flavescens TaxID=28028 RepID=UPI0028A03F9C|nr:HNH endonuclease signature motif containing protein [Corynebacterium flavescens]
MSGFTSNRRKRVRGVPPGLRRRVMRRDQGQCQKRGPRCTLVATEVDHIVSVAEGGTDDLNNLEAICSACHAPKTQAEAQRGRVRYSRKRPPQAHPAFGQGRAVDWAAWARAMGKG